MSDDDLDELVLQQILSGKGAAAPTTTAATTAPAAPAPAAAAPADDSDDDEMFQRIMAEQQRAKAAGAAPDPAAPGKPSADRDSPDSDELLAGVLGGDATSAPVPAPAPVASAPVPVPTAPARTATPPSKTAESAKPAASVQPSAPTQPPVAPLLVSKHHDADEPARRPPPPQQQQPQQPAQPAPQRTATPPSDAPPPPVVPATAANTPATAPPAQTAGVAPAPGTLEVPGSPTVDQLIEESRHHADPAAGAPLTSSAAAAASDDDADDEEAEKILQQLLKTQDAHDAQSDSAEHESHARVDAALAAVQAPGADRMHSTDEAVLRQVFASGGADADGNELSLQGEADVLQAIIDALKGTAAEEDEENADMMSALRQAERMAAAGVSNRGAGQSVLRMHEVQGLADQFKRARTTVGTPACMAAASGRARVAFAVGTSVGFAVLFDARCKLLGLCGGAGAASEGARGSCTSIALNCDGTLLVTGHDRGAIAVWDTQTLQPVKVIADELSSPVFRCQFMHPDPLKCIAVDGTGVIKILSCSRVMKSLMVRVIDVDAEFSSMCSDAGSTCVSVTNPETHETKDLHYIAAVCPEGAVVFTATFGLTTSVDRLAFIPQPAADDANNATEVLAWITRPSGPVLCLCWGVRVTLHNIVSGEMMPIGTVTMPAATNSVGVLDGGCLLLGDQNRNVNVVDTTTGVVVEMLQLFSVEPVCYSHRSCGIKHQGGFCHAGGVTYVMGEHRVLACSVVPWEARLDTLVGLKHWDEALDLARGFANETALAVVGLSSVPSIRKDSVTQYIVTLLTSFIADVMRKAPPAADVVKLMDTIINFCSDIGAMDTLFGAVASFFDNLDNGPRFDAATLAALVAKRLTTIPEHVIPRLVRFADANPDFADLTNLGADDADTRRNFLEHALMMAEHVDDALLTTGKEHSLWRLVCVVWTSRRGQPESCVIDLCGVADSALAEFVTALFEGHTLLPGESLSRPTITNYQGRLLKALVEHPQAINRIAVASPTPFLESIECVGAKDELWFPHTEVKKTNFMTRLWQAVCLPVSTFKEPWRMEKHTVSADSQVVCLRILARAIADGAITFDKKTLTTFVDQASFALAYAHDRPDAQLADRIAIQKDLALFFSNADPAAAASGDVEKELAVKRMIRPLAQIKVAKKQFANAISLYTDADNATVNFDPHVREDVFDFLGDILQRYEGDRWRLPTVKIAIKEKLGDLFAVDPTRLARFVFRHLPNDKEDIIRLLVTRGDHTDAKAQYLFMGEMFTTGRADPSREELTEYIMLKCQFDPDTVYDYLVDLGSADYEMSPVLDCCRELGISKACIYLYEKALMIPQAMELLSGTLGERMLAARDAVFGLSQLPPKEREATLNASACGATFADGGILRESTLIADTTTVVSQIESAGDAMGQIQPTGPEEEAVLEIVNVGISMCKRYQKVMDEAELSDIWFSLLDTFAKPKQLLVDRLTQSAAHEQIAASGRLHDAAHSRVRRRQNSMMSGDSHGLNHGPIGEDEEVVNEIDIVRHGWERRVAPVKKALREPAKYFHMEMAAFYGKYVSYVLSNMVQVLELPIVVAKIIKDNEREKFGPFKPILVGILQKLNFNLHANELCRDCTNDDVFDLHDKLRRTVASAIVPKGTQCPLCGQHLSLQVEDDDTLKFFRCGHGFHELCLKQQSECPVCVMEARFGPSAASMFGTHSKAPQQPQNAAVHTTASHAHRHDGATDIPTMMRRMRRTSMKIEGNRNFTEILDQLLAKDAGSRLRESSKVGSASARGLVLAPAPPQAVVTELFVGRLATIANSTIKEHFTEDEVRDIFGADEPYNMDENVPTEEDEAAALQQALADSDDAQHVAGDERDDELDW